jgi:hypothetical protein
MSTGHTRPDSLTACFAIRAVAEAGTLSRLIEPFAKRNLVPSSVEARVLAADPETLVVDLQIDGLEPALADAIAETIRQMVPVERVLLGSVPAAFARPPDLRLTARGAGGPARRD